MFSVSNRVSFCFNQMFYTSLIKEIWLLWNIIDVTENVAIHLEKDLVKITFSYFF